MYLTETSCKWSVIVKKAQKYQAGWDIDTVINDKIFPEALTEKPRRFNRHKTNTSLVTYVTTFQNKSTPSTIKFHNPTQYAYKYQFQPSYDIENEDSFPVIDNKKEIHPQK